MGQAAASPYVNVEDYFEAETTAAGDAPKHEWFDGVVYAMSRGSPEHGRLTYRASIVLAAVLPADCTGYASDTMIHIELVQLSTYADLSIVWGPLQTIAVYKNGKSLGKAITNPIVIIEVLSEATERYDRDGKFQAYKQLASLEEYVLISQDERRVEVFRKRDDWRGEAGIAGGSIDIHGARVSVDDVYR